MKKRVESMLMRSIVHSVLVRCMFCSSCMVTLNLTSKFYLLITPCCDDRLLACLERRRAEWVGSRGTRTSFPIARDG